MMPMRLDEDDNIAYSKDHAMQIQSDLLDEKPAEEPKPEEKTETETAQPEPEHSEQSLEY